MICPYCQQPARWVDNAEIYGRRYGMSYMMWWCEPCDARVGCHKNTKRALGTLANKELREWRMKAHAHIDPHWKLGKMSRGRVYEILNQHFGREMHVGESDIAACQEILKVKFD